MGINAKLISEMLPLLGGDTVLFEIQKVGIVLIQSGNASFQISCLPGTHYPKPELPEPESLVILTGLRTLARQTAFAARKPGRDANIYTNVRLEVYPTELRMIATDTIRLAIARHRQVTGGQTVLLIPAPALTVLTGISGDEKVEAGVVKNTLVFKGYDYVFTTRTMAGEFMDINEILKTVQPLYDAAAPSKDLWNDVDRLVAVAEDEISQFNLVMGEAGISLAYDGEFSRFRTTTEAVVYRPTPEAGFYYGVRGFSQALRHMKVKEEEAADGKEE